MSGAGGVASDVEEYVAARGSALQVLAVLVTGEEREARAAVHEVLGRVVPRWDALVHDVEPDAHLRRELVRRLLRPRPLSSHLSSHVHSPRREPDADGWDATADQRALWEVWLSLPRESRAVMALRHADGRTPAEVATLLETSERRVRAREETATARLARAGGATDDLPARLLATLAARVDASTAWPVELLGRAERAGRRRRNRRLRLVAVAGVVALVAAPVVTALAGDFVDGVDREGDDSRIDVPLPAGWRVESWRGVEVGVPPEWGHGSLEEDCPPQEQPTPVVDRYAGGVPAPCATGLAPGLQFRVVGQSPPDQDLGPGLVADERRIGGVVVMVVTPTAELTEQVLATAHAVERVDSNGCAVQRSIPRAGKNFPPVAVEPGDAVSLCRYVVGVPGANLVESERLTGGDAEQALDAVAAAPSVVAQIGCLDSPGEEAVALSTVEGDLAWIHLGRCQAVDEELTRLPTPDVLNWVLSPGWAGPGDGLPLPPRLRTAG